MNRVNKQEFIAISRDRCALYQRVLNLIFFNSRKDIDCQLSAIRKCDLVVKSENSRQYQQIEFFRHLLIHLTSEVLNESIQAIL